MYDYDKDKFITKYVKTESWKLPGENKFRHVLFITTGQLEKTHGIDINIDNEWRAKTGKSNTCAHVFEFVFLLFEI